MTNEQVRMSIGDHLDELRTRVVRALIAVVIASAICLYFGSEIVTFVCRPVVAAMTRAGMTAGLINLTPQEGFMVYLKVSLLCGVILAAPYVFREIWGFIASGLYPHERKWVNILAPFSGGLFAFGVVFLYFLVLPATLYFFLQFQSSFLPLPDVGQLVTQTLPQDNNAPEQLSVTTQPTSQPARIPVLAEPPQAPDDGQMWIDQQSGQVLMAYGDRVLQLHVSPAGTLVRGNSMSLASYVTFVIQLSLAFGLGFQVPIVVVFLALSDIMSLSYLRRVRRYVVLIIMIVAAILTPADLQSQLLLAAPMMLLYELGLIVAARMVRHRVHA